MTAPSHAKVNEFEDFLGTLGYSTLVRWARQVGVAHPEMYRSKAAYGARLSEAAAKAKLVQILKSEFKADSPGLRDVDADGLPVPPDPNQWWNYYGKAGEFGSFQHRPVQAPTTLRELVDIVGDAVAAGPVPIRAVGGGHSNSDVAVPRPGSVFLTLSKLGTIDRGEPAGDLAAANEDVDDQEASQELAQGFFDAWNANENLDSAAVERALQPVDEALGVTGRGHLARVPAGIKLRHLNYILWANGRAMLNLGNFAEQALWGAVTTGTHGSGIRFGALSTAVASVDVLVVRRRFGDDLVTRILRVEPTDGITRRDGFESNPARQDWELIQDDDLFHAITVSMGCMGVVFAVTLRVTDRYALRNEAVREDWEKILDQSNTEEWLYHDLSRIEELLRRVSADDMTHARILINPYRSDGTAGDTHGAVIDKVHDRRFLAEGDDVPDVPKPLPAEAARSWKDGGPSYLWREVEPDIASWPEWRNRIGLGFGELSNDFFFGRGYRALTGGVSYFVLGAGCEIALPMGTLLAALERVFAMVEDYAKREAKPGPLWTSAPIGLRFVKTCDDWLAPTYRWIWGREEDIVCMMQFSTVFSPKHASRQLAMLNAVAAQLSTAEFRGRPHWGDVNQGVRVDSARLREMYGDAAVDAWTAAYCYFNSEGVFDNDFVGRLELDCSPYRQSREWLPAMLNVMMPAGG